MTLEDELAAFYAKCGFGSIAGKRPLTVRVYTGCLLVPMPNIETRRRYLKYHDLHHLVTGYSVGRIGEGEVSAWELGSGSIFAHPLLGVMNLIALSTGLVLARARMWRAFERGCRSRNLYAPHSRAAVDAGSWADVAELRVAILESRPARGLVIWRAIEFGIYAVLALLIHAAIAIPAAIVRVVTDIGMGYNFFQAIKPARRADLY